MYEVHCFYAPLDEPSEPHVFKIEEDLYSRAYVVFRRETTKRFNDLKSEGLIDNAIYGSDKVYFILDHKGVERWELKETNNA